MTIKTPEQRDRDSWLWLSSRKVDLCWLLSSRSLISLCTSLLQPPGGFLPGLFCFYTHTSCYVLSLKPFRLCIPTAHLLLKPFDLWYSFSNLWDHDRKPAFMLLLNKFIIGWFVNTSHWTSFYFKIFRKRDEHINPTIIRLLCMKAFRTQLFWTFSCWTISFLKE